MRPDRIIVGEVRGAEALDMLQAMNTGHDGSLSTIHANTPRDALARVETMVLMAGYDLPVKAIRQQVASALDLIIHLERMQDGSRRVTAITEVGRMESDVITLSELFKFKVDERAGGPHRGRAAARDRPAPDVPRQVRAPRDHAAASLFGNGARVGRPTSAGASRRERAARIGALVARSRSPRPRRRGAAHDGLRLTEAAGAPFPERSYALTLPRAAGARRRPSAT